MDVQLDFAATHDDHLEFSGDETEICGAVSTAAAGFDRHLEHYWSMSSLALAIASLDFYIQYLQKTDRAPADYTTMSGAKVNLLDELARLRQAMDRDFWRTDLPDYPIGFYDWCRVKEGNSLPAGRITNFAAFPLYYGAQLAVPGRAEASARAMKIHLDASTGLLPLVPVVGDGWMLGHTLGYLEWALIRTNDPAKTQVYRTLSGGPTVGCWGSYYEANSPAGGGNKNSLRTFETGVNISALALYWNLGQDSLPSPAK